MTFLPCIILFLGTFHMGISVHSSAKDESSTRETTSPHATYPQEAEPAYNINLKPVPTEGINRTPEDLRVIPPRVLDINGNPCPDA
jgi:hypothetical protein